MNWVETRDYLGHQFRMKKGNLLATVFKDYTGPVSSYKKWAFTIGRESKLGYSFVMQKFASKNDPNTAKLEAEKALKRLAP